MAKLAAVVEGLKHHVQHLAMILDEVREDLIAAVRNDKLTCPNYSQHFVASQIAPTSEVEDDDEVEDDEEGLADPPPPPAKPIASPKRTLFE